jgi:phosphatidylglycerophosphate synthase
VLLVVPSEPGAGGGVPPETVVAGLPLLRRIVLAGARAGFAEIRVHKALAVADDLLAGTPAAPLTPDEPDAPRARRRIVILPANVVPQPGWLRGLLGGALCADTAYADASLTVVIETADPGRVLAAAARSRGAGELLGVLRGGFADPPATLAAAGRFVLTARADVAAAERWLLRGLIKQSEGFLSRHFERRISLALTRRLVRTRLTPDAMTLVSLAIGLTGAPFFLSPSPALQLTGALLFLAHSILDGCDGEIARLKFQESRRGAILDFWGDNLVHVAVFGSIAIGWSLAAGTGWPLLLGAVTIASALGSAACVFKRTMLDLVPAAGAGMTDRVAEAMAHRDFIYLVVLLSALGRADWFLVLASAGTPIFLLLLLWVGAPRRAA